MNLSKYLRQSVRWLFGWFGGRTAPLCLTTLMSLLWFTFAWNLDTTFRSYSDPMLYVVNILAALVLLSPWIASHKAWLQLTVIALLDILLEANLMYNRTYLTAIPASSYGLAGNMADFTDSIADSFRIADIGFPVILALGAYLTYRRKRECSPRLVLRWMSCTALFAAVAGIMITARGGFYKAYDSLIQSCYYFTCGTPTYTVAGHITYNIMDHKRNETLSDADRQQIDSWLEVHKASVVIPDSIENRRSLVFIYCESLESWPIESDVNGKPIAPYLRSLINDSTTLYAPRVLTQVGAGHSIDAQLLYTAGMMPTINSVYSMKYPTVTYPTLNKALKADRGAKSVMMTPDKIFTWNQGTIARTFGYDSIVWRKDWIMDETILRKLSDGSFLRQSVGMLQKGELWPEGEPAMFTFITYTGHNPFKLNDEQKDPDFSADATDMPQRLRDYITTTHYVDSQLPVLINYLKSRNDYKDMLIVIAGDHEALGIDRAKMRDESADARAIVADGPFTPLIILNSPVTGRHDCIVGQVDVYSTLLDLLGVPDNGWRGMGTSIISPTHIPAAYTSVPQQLYGDTTGITPRRIEHLRRTREISDKIIIHDLLAK